MDEVVSVARASERATNQTCAPFRVGLTTPDPRAGCACHYRTMLIDSFAPNPDAVETHSISMAASRDAVYRALWTADFGSPVIKLLLGLRSLPGFVARGFRSVPRRQKITLQILLDSGFGVLASTISCNWEFISRGCRVSSSVLTASP